MLIAQLEHQAHTDATFSLQKLWFYLNASNDTMASLSHLISSILKMEKELNDSNVLKPSFLKKAKPSSARILNLISEQGIALGGNPETKKLFQFLFEKSLIPFTKMLQEWLYKGSLSDPYHEFFISENEKCTKENLNLTDLYWEQRYTLVEECLPTFLQPLKDKIFVAGKYLNVILECRLKLLSRDDMIDLYETKNKKQPPEAFGFHFSKSLEA
jgi:gamma-tubulin complex component 2